MNGFGAYKAYPVKGKLKRGNYTMEGGALKEGGQDPGEEWLGFFWRNRWDNPASATGPGTLAGPLVIRFIFWLTGPGIPEGLYFSKLMSLKA